MRAPLLLILALSACDGAGSELCDDGFEPLTWYADADDDGYGDASDPGEVTCTPARDQVNAAGDCDDSNPDVFPDAPERCNGIDDNCDPSDDLTDGQVAFNGVPTDDLAGDLLRRDGAATVTICGTHDLSNLVIPSRITSVTFEGNPDGSSVLQTSGFDMEWSTQLTLRDLQFDGVHLLFAPGQERLVKVMTLNNVEIVDGARIEVGFAEGIVVDGLTGAGRLAAYSNELDIKNVDLGNLVVSGNGDVVDCSAEVLTVVNSVQVSDSEARRFLSVAGGPLLENMTLTNLNGFEITPQGRTRFVNSPVGGPGSSDFKISGEQGGVVEGLDFSGELLVLGNGGSVELRQPQLHDGGGIRAVGQGTLRITGGTITGQTGSPGSVLSTSDDNLVFDVIVRDTVINGNGTSGVPLFQIDDRDTLELNAAQIGTGADANTGTLIDFGGVQYDNTGEVSVTCEAGSCTEG